jgi:hypothetical protein
MQAELRWGPPAAGGERVGLDERFEEFHLANPLVYTALRALALKLLASGVRRYGIAGLFEVLRYEHVLRTRGEEFKLNNSFRAFYARRLMEREPRLDGFFETRTQRYEGPESRQWG